MANGKTAVIEKTDKDWEILKGQLQEVCNLLGVIMFFVPILLLGVCYGVRAGLIAMFEKTLEMLKQWGE
uniref:Uncharacterized protein n=1 Tax=viral metagenome TaxID=1070528 RepID=A0A6M3KS95_9ZZZZ